MDCYNNFSNTTNFIREDSPEVAFLSGKISLNTQSYVWHPSLLTLNLNLQYRPSIRNSKSDYYALRSQQQSTSKISLNGTILKGKFITLSSFINYTDGKSEVENITSIETQNKNWGFNLFSRNKYLPVHLFYQNINLEQLELISGRNYYMTKDYFRGRTGRSFQQYGNFQFTYTYEDYIQNMVDQYSLNNTINRFDLISGLFFDKKKIIH